jgi:hypothetical protein
MFRAYFGAYARERVEECDLGVVAGLGEQLGLRSLRPAHSKSAGRVPPLRSSLHVCMMVII